MGNTENKPEKETATIKLDDSVPTPAEPTPARGRNRNVGEEDKIKGMNIYEKMLNISIELTTVNKNLEVTVSKNGKYKAVGEADVLRAVKPLEFKYRILSFPFSREIIESGTLESTDFNGNTKKQLFERIKTVYRFINVDNTNEIVDVIGYGDGIDTGDKSVGKAMTYADKYAIMKAYKIVTGDDPDQDASDANLNDTKIKKKELDPELVAVCAELNIDLSKVATYFKKKVEDLTDEEVTACIEKKKASLEKVAERKALND